MVIAQALEDINGYTINQLKLEWLLNTAADQRDKNCANGKRMIVDHSVLLFDKFWFPNEMNFLYALWGVVTKLESCPTIHSNPAT